MTSDDDRRAARRWDEPRARHYTLTGRRGHRVPTRRYWVLGLAGLAGVLLVLLGGALLSYAETSPDERPSLLHVLTSKLWYPEWNSQVATPSARSNVPAPATSLPNEPRYVAQVPPPASPTVSRATPTPPPAVALGASGAAGGPLPPTAVGGAESAAARGPLPPTTLTPSPTDMGVASSSPTPDAVALPPPHKPTLAPDALAAIPAFGAPAVLATKTLVPPTPTLSPPTPTLPPPPSAVPTSLPSLSAQPSLVAAAVGSSSLPPTPTVAPSATALPRDYKLGDTVAITQVLKGFAFTDHWSGSREGVYATDWYPRSATQTCANSHRLPLAMPVAGNWRLSSLAAPMGGTQYTLIGELDDGNSVGFTHVDRDVLTGRAAANTVVGFVGLSGLESFDAAGLNPSHAHTAWNDRVISGWDGDKGNRPARDFFGRYGFQVEIRDSASGASPQNYMMRQGCGGMQSVRRPAARR
jgi:hypothetical protein